MLSIESGSRFLSNLTWFLSHQSSFVLTHQPWNDIIFASNISLAYQSILDRIKLSSAPHTHEVELQPFLPSDYELHPLLPVHDLYLNSACLKEYLVDFLLHGSISTLDFSLGWSDIDTLLIVSDDTLLSPYKLVQLRNIIVNLSSSLYQFDHLQHHEFIFTTESLNRANSSFSLPSEVFSYSKSLFQTNSVTLSTNRSFLASQSLIYRLARLYKTSMDSGVFNHHKKNGKALSSGFLDKDTMYQLKYFVSTVLTFPTYLYDAVGSPRYKKHSFYDLDGFMPRSFSFISLLESIRDDWSRHQYYPYKSDVIPDWILELLSFDIFSSAHDMSLEAISIIDSYD